MRKAFLVATVSAMAFAFVADAQTSKVEDSTGVNEVTTRIAEQQRRVEQKKKELQEKGIDVESIAAKQIEELLEQNVVTVDDAQSIFPEETLMKVKARTVFERDPDGDISWRGIVFLIGEILYDLRYYAEDGWAGEFTPKLREAVKEFQRSLEHEPTGELLCGEFAELTERYEKLHLEPIGLPLYWFHAYEGHVTLKGTWVFKDRTPHAFPIHTSVIEFDKSTMRGVEAKARLSELMGSTLYVDLDYWRVTKWDPQEIVAENDAPLNASYTLTVNLINEKVYMYRRHKGEDILGEVAFLPAILELVDGLDVAKEFHRKRQEEVMAACNPKYKSLKEKMSGLAKKQE